MKVHVLLSMMITDTATLQIDFHSPADIIQRCIDGERAAQKQLYDNYRSAMFTTAVRITNDTEIAADVLQDGFLEVFRNLKSFKRESTIGAWIKTIIVREALRKTKFECRYQSFDVNEHDGMVEQLQSFTAMDIADAITKLPDGYRSVFTLVEIEGYSHRETAELLGISENTSRSQLHHSKKQLQVLLNHLRS